MIKNYNGINILYHKDKYPILYKYISNLNINMENIFIMETPVGVIYYLDIDFNLFSDSVGVYYKTYEEIKNHLAFSKVYIYPEEDMKILFPGSQHIKYNDYLRIYLTEPDKVLNKRLRKQKFNRLIQ